MAAKLELENVKMDYDQEGDVLYIYFGEPTPADDSHVTDEGVVVRTRDSRIVGLTILSARERLYLS
ncbi:MAG: DUF2283 domain-containing protein [Chloroflexi bacterium]|nr:DUF2283 domain-containing protein [Chloroflexota bacterium]